MTTSEILQKIREANPELKELSFGCEVTEQDRGDRRQKSLGKIGHIIRGGYGNPCAYKVWFEGNNSVSLVFNEEGAIEIIGHPVHLEHLLKVLGSRYAITGKGGIWKYEDHEWKIVDIGLCYFIDKSVQANLESNEALREFISEVLS